MPSALGEVGPVAHSDDLGGLALVPSRTSRRPRVALALAREQNPIRGPVIRSLDPRGDYEAALELARNGLESAAEIGFLRVARSTPGDAIGEELRLRSLMWVAGVRRDRFNLSGTEGAMAMYDAMLREMPPHLLQLSSEIRFVQGACWEMLGRNLLAARTYAGVLAGAPTRDTALVARLNTRIGAALTKEGELEAAQLHLRRSNQLVELIPSSGVYSFTREKRAVLRASTGDLAGAMDDVMEARGYIPAASHLRQVQSWVAESSILLRAGEAGAASTRMDLAETVAAEHSYGHQLARIRWMRSSVSAFHRPKD